MHQLVKSGSAESRPVSKMYYPVKSFFGANSLFTNKQVVISTDSRYLVPDSLVDSHIRGNEILSIGVVVGYENPVKVILKLIVYTFK